MVVMPRRNAAIFNGVSFSFIKITRINCDKKNKIDVTNAVTLKVIS